MFSLNTYKNSDWWDCFVFPGIYIPMNWFISQPYEIVDICKCPLYLIVILMHYFLMGKNKLVDPLGYHKELFTDNFFA